MTTALAFLATALLGWPGSSARYRLRELHIRTVGTPLRIAATWPAALGCAAVGVIASWHAAVAGVILLGTLRIRMRKTRAARAKALQRDALLDGLDGVIAELRVGAHPSAACNAAAADCAAPISGVLAVAAARSRLGGNASDGMRDSNSGVTRELDRIADAWSVAESHGLALAELLLAAREDLLGRKRFRGRTEAGLAGARASAAVLAGLPLLGVLLGEMMGAAPIGVLLGGGIGGILLIIGTALACAGLLWTDAITGRVTA